MTSEVKRQQDPTSQQPAYVQHYLGLGETLGQLLIGARRLLARTGGLARRSAAAIARGQQRRAGVRAASALDIARRQQATAFTHKVGESAANEDKYRPAA